MPRLTRITTRKGDRGETGLIDGTRVPKDSPRVCAIGAVDELNAHLGMALSLGLDPELAAQLVEIQQTLFSLGGDLATPGGDPASLPAVRVTAEHVQMLEAIVERLNSDLPALDNFILPGGSRSSAQLHIARTVCRRAEREVVALARSEALAEHALPYLNRLSDALFVMARCESRRSGQPEVLAR